MRNTIITLTRLALLPGFTALSLILMTLGCLLWCSIAPSAASTLKGYYQFGENNEGAQPNSIVSLANGSYLVTTFYGGAYTGGTISLVTGSGKAAILHSFSSTVDGRPIALFADSDGYFYGLTADYANEEANYHGTFFRFALDGSYEAISHFSNSGGIPAQLVQGTDGNYYVLCNGITQLTKSGGMRLITSQTPTSFIQASDGNLYGINGTYLYRYTLQGAATVIHTLPAGELGGNLVQGKDGYLYGAFTSQDVYVFKIETNGAGFSDASMGYEGYPSDLILAYDGNFYLADSLTNQLRIFRVTTSLVSTNVYYASYFPYGYPTIQPTANGNICGVVGVGPDNSLNGFVLTLSPTGVATDVHDFLGPDGLFGTSDTSTYAASTKAVITSTGEIYGITPGGGLYGNGTFYHIDPSGNETVLASFTTDNFDPASSGDLEAIARSSNGTLYGAWSLAPNEQYSGVNTYVPGETGDPNTTAADFASFNEAESNSLLEGSDGYLYGICTGPYGEFFWDADSQRA